jgi:molybdenum cofactor biosynthesis enzyme
MASFTKQPSELFTIAVDFTDRMATGEALATAVVTATDSAGADKTSTVIHASPSVSSPNVLVRVKAGTDGVDYKITVVATTATSEVYEADVTMRVRAE